MRLNRGIAAAPRFGVGAQAKRVLEKAQLQKGSRRIIEKGPLLAEEDTAASSKPTPSSGKPQLFVQCENGLKAKVLKLDKQFIVVSKPNGVLSQPDHTGDESLVESTSAFLKEHYNKPGNAYTACIHRLDRPVSGVTVLACTSKAASRLSEQVRERQFKKDYLAVVPKKHVKQGVSKGVIKGADEEAALEWKELFAVRNLYSVLLISIETGKKHQIRKQLMQGGIGPIVGNLRFNSTFRAPKNFHDSSRGIMLHASRLSFWHPIDHDKRVTISCPPPWPREFVPSFFGDETPRDRRPIEPIDEDDERDF